MTQQAIEILTPVGRLVQGSCFEANTKDATGAPLTYKTGPQAGQPRVDFFMAIAIPKTDPGINDILQKIQTAAQTGFPQGQYNSPTFAWKVIDGDGVDRQGQPHANKEGFAGCWVLKFSGGYAPKCYSKGGETLLTDPQSIKRGYYIRIYGSVVANGSVQQPGVYLNHSLVELIGYGEEIVSGPDGASIFGGAPVAQLPQGASATPLAPTTPMAHPGFGGPAGMPGAGQPGMQPQGAPGAMPGGQPQGFGAPAMQPQATPGMPPAGAPGMPQQQYQPQPGPMGTQPAPTGAAPGMTQQPGQVPNMPGVQPYPGFGNPQ